jgi:hypothetical protein
MLTTFRSLLLVSVLALFLTGCKDKNSIQTYFVDHQELPDFVNYPVSASLIDVSKSNLTKEEQATYNSIKKLDFLAYRLGDNTQEEYNTELEKAKKVLSNKKYEALMEFKDKGINVEISTIGNEDTVDEFLILGSSKKMGFGVVRVIGDDMKPEELIKLVNKLQNADVDSSQFKGIIDLFK